MPMPIPITMPIPMSMLMSMSKPMSMSMPIEVAKLARPGGLARSTRNLGRAGPLNYWLEKNRAKFGPAQYGPARYGLTWPCPPEFFLPSKGYLARSARFLGRAGLLNFCPEKSWPILALPGFGPAHCWPDPAQPDPPDCQL